MIKKSILIFEQKAPSLNEDVIEYKNTAKAKAVVKTLTSATTLIEAKVAFDLAGVGYGVYTRPKRRPRT